MIPTLDIIAAIFSFLSTIFYIKVDKHAWPLSFVATSIGVFLYFDKGLYSDCALHLIYLCSIFYGWYEWLYGGKDHKELLVSSMSPKVTLILSSIAIVSIICISAFLKYEINSQVSYLDATTTVLSLIAQWMLCKKIIQCWHLWFVVDVLFAVMYFYKGLPAHGILYGVYTGMAVIGYLNWRRQLTNDYAVVIC